MARAWHLMSRPSGLPTSDNFALKEVSLPPLSTGMVRVCIPDSGFCHFEERK